MRQKCMTVVTKGPMRQSDMHDSYVLSSPLTVNSSPCNCCTTIMHCVRPIQNAARRV